MKTTTSSSRLISVSILLSPGKQVNQSKHIALITIFFSHKILDQAWKQREAYRKTKQKFLGKILKNLGREILKTLKTHKKNCSGKVRS